MNDSVYICAASLCCCLVVCSIVRIIVPTGNTTRILSVVISVFVLCCLLTPILDLIKDFRLSSFESDSLEEKYEIDINYDEFVMRETANYLNEYVNHTLESSGVQNSSIQTVLAIDENKGIYIREMIIYLYTEELKSANEIKELVLKSVGIEPKVLECVYG